MGIRDRHQGVLTQAEVEDELLRFVDRLEEETLRYRDLAEEASSAEVTYKREFALARLAEREGTAADKDARATLKAQAHLERHRLAEGQLKAQARLLDYLDTTVGALRTMAANVRSQT